MIDTLLPQRSLLDRAAETLRRGRVPEPRREALRIWGELGGHAAPSFLAAVERRAGGEPLAYVTGRVGFRYLTLRADRRALIPRPETEQLVELALAVAPVGRAADVGTGTGCLALSLATEGAYSEVIALDRSRDALALAAINRKAVGAFPVQLVLGELAAPLARSSLDLLVSNPPYVAEHEWRLLPPDVRREPRPALIAGPRGTEVLERIATGASEWLAPGGLVACEIGETQGEAVREAFAVLGDARIRPDLAGCDRYVVVRYER